MSPARGNWVPSGRVTDGFRQPCRAAVRSWRDRSAASGSVRLRGVGRASIGRRVGRLVRGHRLAGGPRLDGSGRAVQHRSGGGRSRPPRLPGWRAPAPSSAADTAGSSSAGTHSTVGSDDPGRVARNARVDAPGIGVGSGRFVRLAGRRRNAAGAEDADVPPPPPLEAAGSAAGACCSGAGSGGSTLRSDEPAPRIGLGNAHDCRRGGSVVGRGRPAWAPPPSRSRRPRPLRRS